ncbi:L,D-transpeptidase family protein [Luteibacter aegosomatissinici]|uniref:L,D-transpeptidase family protein n=1 Tax=Luteibacter aegosomatissinici TaxID=2911539 RepID=UPI001FFB192E|nr:L,D-transpeptidase family protein [Luteibacter aegosomatissinici]UPG93756.1 L,D-transpeptidase family protein [Luteibacter aegosomatissinici]
MAFLPRLAGLLALSLTVSASAFEAPASWSVSRQMIVVTTGGWNDIQGTLRTYTREGGTWKQVSEPAPVVIGKTGSAWGVGLSPPQSNGPQKREGDGRSPAGIFRVGTAFGYAESNPTALPYKGLTASDYCVDVDGSPYYNQLVDEKKVGEKAVAGATEAMRRDIHFQGDHAYRIGFVIEHNPDGKKGAGSCIFAHLWKTPTSGTAGCTAMADTTMERLLAWLDPSKKPVVVLLPKAEYARLRDAWNLPAL